MLIHTLATLEQKLTVAQKESKKLARQYCEAYEKRDLVKMKLLFTKDAIIIGTGGDEILKGWKDMEKQLKRDWSQSKTGHIEMHEPIDYFDCGLFCLCTAVVTLLDGKVINWEGLRLTMNVVKDGEAWKISSCHFSAPAVNQEIGSSFPKL